MLCSMILFSYMIKRHYTVFLATSNISSWPLILPPPSPLTCPPLPGDLCSDLVNECGRSPCAEYQLCIPDGTAAGFVCRCPEGRTGPRCRLHASDCAEGQCYTPGAPFSLAGDGFAEYRLLQAQHSRSSLRLSLRTRQPTATVVYAADGVEYSILEVRGRTPAGAAPGDGEGWTMWAGMWCVCCGLEISGRS